MRLSTRLGATRLRGAPPTPLLLPLLLTLMLPLQTTGQLESLSFHSRRSVQDPGKVQQIIRVPDTPGLSHSVRRPNDVSTAFANFFVKLIDNFDVGSGSNSGGSSKFAFGPVFNIKISGVITVGTGSSAGSVADAGPVANTGAQTGTSPELGSANTSGPDLGTTDIIGNTSQIVQGDTGSGASSVVESGPGRFSEKVESPESVSSLGPISNSTIANFSSMVSDHAVLTGPAANTGERSRTDTVTVVGSNNLTCVEERLQAVTTQYGPEFGTIGHVRRKVCDSNVDLKAKHDLRLISYDFPVVGPELPFTCCPRNQVRFRTLDGPCVPVLRQGLCESENQWVLFNNVTNVGECRDRPCPKGRALVKATGFCHDQFQKDFCPGLRLIHGTAGGESVCACDFGWYPDRCGFCRRIHSFEGCPSGLSHQFNTAFELRCLPFLCSRDNPVVLPRGKGCSEFNKSCELDNGLPGVWGFNSVSLEVVCLPVEFALPSHRHLGRQKGSSVGGNTITRFLRSVIGGPVEAEDNMLVSCEPGTRTNYNRICQEKGVPGRKRRDTSHSQPTCEEPRRVVNGNCSGAKTPKGLGK